MPKKTDGEIHHQWTLLQLAADRAEDDLESAWQRGEGIRRMHILRDHAQKRQDIADRYEERYHTRIQKFIKACKGEEG